MEIPSVKNSRGLFGKNFDARRFAKHAATYLIQGEETK